MLDKSGAVVRELTATKEAGINRVQWDLRGKPPVRTERRTAGAAGAGGATGGGGGPFGGPPQGALVDPGEYTARLTFNGRDADDAGDRAAGSGGFDQRRRSRGEAGVPHGACSRCRRRAEPAGARAESAGAQLEALSKTVSGLAAAPRHGEGRGGVDGQKTRGRPEGFVHGAEPVGDAAVHAGERARRSCRPTRSAPSSTICRRNSNSTGRRSTRC